MAAIRIESSLGGNSRLKSSVAVCAGQFTGS
eukprot:CAMPEP_0182617534 /NCGR_PEP_ID=MMETSP1330-20130603/42288_1 /TAXON_ID=464278 /ORGANISM="Picochlorum sp., Strain RCC944" /LENGTH=30 /DNA_ID= /DNA_START= /DNA_END= /DNA_ORIENTATION=